jgi:hypothetical protein
MEMSSPQQAAMGKSCCGMEMSEARGGIESLLKAGNIFRSLTVQEFA